jgi:hypothetical protein
MQGSSSLFPQEPINSTEHNAGGKVKHLLAAGMRGYAVFSGPDNCYRTLLWRKWGDNKAPYVLFIGMNSSTADGMFNDPTVCREIAFARDLQFTTYYKCNVSPYRATNPDDLRHAAVPLQTADNTATVMRAALVAKLVIAAWGALPPLLREHGRELGHKLWQCKIEIHCLGTTKDGSPRHPLYLPKTAKVRKWSQWAQ